MLFYGQTYLIFPLTNLYFYTGVAEDRGCATNELLLREALLPTSSAEACDFHSHGPPPRSSAKSSEYSDAERFVPFCSVSHIRISGR